MISFSVGGCRLQIHFSCFALLAFCCLFAEGQSSASFLSAVALHEAAHLLTLALFHAPPRSITLSALGCRVIPNREKALSYGKSALVSLAGPCANLFLVLLCFSAGLGDSPFAAANLALGLFHILPIEPLDGSLALRSVLSVTIGPERAGKTVFILSLALLFPLAVLGFLVLLRSKYNFSLLAMCLFFMLYLLLQKDFWIS